MADNSILHRLERQFSDFLDTYGPAGVTTPCGTHLISEKMRNPLPGFFKNKDYPDGDLDWHEIPKELREAIASISGVKLPEIQSEPESEEDDGRQLDLGLTTTRPLDTTRNIAEIGQQGQSDEAGPSGQYQVPRSPPSFASSRLGPNTTPPSHSTNASQQGVQRWGPWGPATHIDEEALQIAIDQHYQSFQMQNKTDEQDGEAPGSSEVFHNSAYEGDEPSVDLWTQQDLGSQLWYPSEEAPPEEAPVYGPENMPADQQVEVEVVAAESLLNLHSTPARPLDSRDDKHEDEEEIEEGGNENGRGKKRKSGLLDAPEITPRPRQGRTKSLIQPFAKSRPDASTTSLSGSEVINMDDPFALSPSAGLGKKRRSTVSSPSPMSFKRRKGMEQETPRAPLGHLRVNAMQGNGFTTPVRSKGEIPPSSLSKTWILSSPGNTDAAASLGLVPQWPVDSMTPGASGLVGSETPFGKRRAWN